MILSSCETDGAADIFARYNSFTNKIIEFGLERDVDRKPMLSVSVKSTHKTI